MGDVVTLDDQRPHWSGVPLCVHCGREWVGVWPDGCESLQCPKCRKMTPAPNVQRHGMRLAKETL